MKRPARLQRMAVYPFARWAKHIEAARHSGRDIIRLDIGGPDLPPPEEVVEALCAASTREDQHGYPGYRGIQTLREAVAAYYWRRFGVELEPGSQVVTLIGSKEGIVNLSLACLDPGDTVLVPDPGYAPYAAGAALAGAEAIAFPLRPGQGYLPDLAEIPPDVADRAVLMWLNYPNNPTGATADLAFFEQAVDFARHHDLILCHDAPYCDVTYDGYLAPSLLQVPGALDHAVEFNSLSKTYNMPGWRLGMAVGNAAVLSLLAQIKSNMDSGIFLPLQQAAVRALSIEPAWVARRNLIYQERLDIVIPGLQRAGIEAARPRATLYVWARVPSGFTSEAFALGLLESTGVAVAPGSFFGSGGEGYVRLSITAPTAQIQEAMDRLESFARPLPASTLGQ